jgi:hypothetical protein
MTGACTIDSFVARIRRLADAEREPVAVLAPMERTEQ